MCVQDLRYCSGLISNLEDETTTLSQKVGHQLSSGDHTTVQKNRDLSYMSEKAYKLLNLLVFFTLHGH